MFEARVVIDGRRQSATAITVFGSHGDERRTDSPAVASVETLINLPRGVWGDIVPGAELLSRVVRDAQTSDALGQSHEGLGMTELPSPLARAAPSDFGRMRSRQETIDLMLGESVPTTLENASEQQDARVVDITSNGTSDVSLQRQTTRSSAASCSRWTRSSSRFQREQKKCGSDTRRTSLSRNGSGAMRIIAFWGLSVRSKRGSSSSGALTWARTLSLSMASIGLALDGRRCTSVGPNSPAFSPELVFTARRWFPKPRRDFTARRRQKSWESRGPIHSGSALRSPRSA